MKNFLTELKTLMKKYAVEFEVYTELIGYNSYYTVFDIEINTIGNYQIVSTEQRYINFKVINDLINSIED